ncbi:hyaluronidase B-like [Oratosquilla oratoria]|uniref:hyaluronidase B-like n=1 Tax=Oratosquilla oratoria TaxID=337810 RepID=UPI003F772EDE
MRPMNLWFVGLAVLICCLNRACAAPSPFPVYWNVPSQQCIHHGIHIEVEQYGITQNTDDVFRGDKMTIFYNPGEFPHFDGDDVINGGIPQRGNLTRHLLQFYNDVIEQVPKDFEGVAVLDFEAYYPSYSMNKLEFKNIVKQWVMEQYPDWNDDQIKAYAELSFNETIKPYFEAPLIMGEALRPKAVWGYYHFPYCHNHKPDDVGCKPSVMEHNDMSLWLFDRSTALFPSIYIPRDGGWDEESRKKHVEGQLNESIRIRKKVGKDMPILPYVHYMYRDVDVFVSDMDLLNTLGMSRFFLLEGAIIWGASKDVSSKEKCLNLQKYVDTSLGPLVLYLQDLPLLDLARAMQSKAYARRVVREAIAKHGPRLKTGWDRNRKTRDRLYDWYHPNDVHLEQTKNEI